MRSQTTSDNQPPRLASLACIRLVSGLGKAARCVVKSAQLQARNMTNETVLVIDDEIETIDLLRVALSRRGYIVLGATNGEQGLNLIHSQKPALLLLDLMMPQVSGYEVCLRLRADPETVKLPIIVLSAVGTTTAEAEALAAGANRFVLKPVSIKVLLDLIAAALNDNL